MGAVISATVFTTRDLGGTPRTQGYFTLEFRNAYTPGGENFDLSTYFRRIDTALGIGPASGANQGVITRVGTDYPTDARSGRFLLDGLASGIGISVVSGTTLFISGTVGISVASGTSLFVSGTVGVSIASGTQIFTSGALLSGQVSGQTFAVLFSGILDGGGLGTLFSGTLAGGGLGTLFSGTVQLTGASGQLTPFRTEILSGVATSGTRFTAWIVGY